MKIKNEIKTDEKKKKGIKEFLATLIMSSALIICLITLAGCGGCFGCLCAGCDSEPDLPDEAVPALVLAMDHQSCMAECLSCFGCYLLEYSESEAAACLGCYDATYYGCSNCGANINDMDTASIKIDSTKIFCSGCYSINISDKNHVYSQGCLIK